MTDITEFSARLRAAIERRGLKQKALARAVGVSSNSLSRYLMGDRAPGRPVILALARELGVSVTWLSEGVGPGPDLQRTPQDISTIARETEALYPVDAVSLVGLDVEERRTVLRMLNALRSGDAEVRQHLIGQLKLIESALSARRQQLRAEKEHGT